MTYPAVDQRMAQTLPRINASTAARWSIVLSGGEGKRMQRFIDSWLGEARPKQYCTFVGTRSMLAHTYDRAKALVPAERIVTIAGESHGKYLHDAISAPPPGLVIEQPRDLGTGPGILLPLSYVLMQDPEATVVLMPSDHFVYPEPRFCNYAAYACDLAEQHPEQLVLLAAVPDRIETDYGWIGLGAPFNPIPWRRKPEMESERLAHYCVRKAAYFREKPSALEAAGLFSTGGVWSTMVIAVKAKTLWAMAHECLPELMPSFDAWLQVLRGIRSGCLNADCEREMLERMYTGLRPADFSGALLERMATRCMVVPMHGVAWCDWGRPQRVVKTLAEVGRTPSFPTSFLESAFGSPAFGAGCVSAAG